MKKADILAALKNFPYDRGDYRVVTGGAMVLYGLREDTHDIDLGCTSKMADRLEAEGYLHQVMPDGNRWFRLDKDTEVFENWLYGAPVMIDGIPVISLSGLLEMKQKLGREKDLRDMELIRGHMEMRRDQLQRIARYEGLLNSLRQALSRPDASAEELAALRGDAEALGQYYGSADWKKDFSDDEAGWLPKDLARGVLSEDGIYNVLEAYRERLEETAAGAD